MQWARPISDGPDPLLHIMLSALLGLGPKVDIVQLLMDGAIVVDMRIKDEYANGHAQGSINIPLVTLEQELHHLERGAPVITCCANGMRSDAAASILCDHGFKAHNGGAWTNVQAALNSR